VDLSRRRLERIWCRFAPEKDGTNLGSDTREVAKHMPFVPGSARMRTVGETGRFSSGAPDAKISALCRVCVSAAVRDAQFDPTFTERYEQKVLRSRPEWRIACA
jgi:hypothetical protein